MSAQKPSIIIKHVLETSVLFLLLSIFSIQSHADLSVGDTYGGGTVFCVSQTPDLKSCVIQGAGKYGLIMANEDQANFDSPNHGVHWANERKEIKAAQSDDDGLSNTKAIIAAHPKDNPSNNAAWLCYEYNRTHGQDASKDLSGWYLPAKDELNKIYLFAKANNLIGKGCAGSKAGGVQCLVGGGNYEGDKDWNKDNQYKIYWSSTEYSGSYVFAWSQFFTDGYQYDYYKATKWLVWRACRSGF